MHTAWYIQNVYFAMNSLSPDWTKFKLLEGGHHS